jgi:hypothetical protein
MSIEGKEIENGSVLALGKETPRFLHRSVSYESFDVF